MTSTSKKILALAAVVVALATAGGGYFTSRPIGLAQSRHGSAAPVAASATTAVAFSNAGAAPASALMPAPVAVAPRQLASASVRQVLPSIQYRVSDWRQFSPNQLTVEATPGCPVAFEIQSVKKGGPRGDMTVWTGANADIPGALFISVATADGWTGTMHIPGADEQLITVRGDDVSVSTRHGGGCSTVEANAALTTAASPSEASTQAAAITTVNTVDVLFFYTDETATAMLAQRPSANVQTEVEILCTQNIEFANQFLTQSGVNNLLWRFIGAYKLNSYPIATSMAAELSQFTGNATVTTQMNTTAADQAVLLLSTAREVETMGIANRPGSHAVTYWFIDSGTVCHEMAHNFGCRHDRTTEGAADNDGAYNYGYRATYNGKDWGTIMSYAGTPLAYFSNPDIQISSAALVAGTSDQLTIGATGARAADDARWMREHAAGMAATRSPLAVPVITAAPVGTTITAGQSFSLSVTATGGNLAYQWAKGGVDIAGATAATYSKIGATADTGSYTVKISNAAGNVTSTAVSVTVNAAPVVPPVTPPSSGGGGGGALSGWFLLALAALWFQKRR